MSQGRAQYTMQFDHYEQVPQAVAPGDSGEIRLIWLPDLKTGPEEICPTG
jgi:translation elongation factor EF-G